VIIRRNAHTPETVHLVDVGLDVPELPKAIENRSRQYVLFHRDEPAHKPHDHEGEPPLNLDNFPKGYTKVATFQGNRDPGAIEFLTREREWPEKVERLPDVRIHAKEPRETGPGDILVEKNKQALDVFHIVESDDLKEVRVLENKDGTLTNIKYNDHPRARNWVARIQPSNNGSGPFQRQFLPRASSSRVFASMVSVGDRLEFGGDYLTSEAQRIKDRAYFEVLGTREGLKVREIDPSTVHQTAERTPSIDEKSSTDPPSPNETMDKIQAYHGTTAKIGSHRSQGRYFTLDAPVDDRTRVSLGTAEITIDRSMIYDPYGQIEGADAAKSEKEKDTIETTMALRMDARLVKDSSPAAQMAKASIRAEVLTDYGYQAEAAVTVFKDGFTRDLVIIDDQVSVKELSIQPGDAIRHAPRPETAKPGAVELLSNYLSETQMAEIGLAEIKGHHPRNRSSEDPSHTNTYRNQENPDMILEYSPTGRDLSSPIHDVQSADHPVQTENTHSPDKIAHEALLSVTERLRGIDQPFNEEASLNSYPDGRHFSPELTQIIAEQRVDMRADQEMKITPQTERPATREMEMEI